MATTGNWGRKKWGPLSGAVALTVTLTMGACSSSTKNAATAPSSSPASSGNSAPAAGTPIQVGLICGCSGPFGGSAVGATDVYKAWVNTVNGAGGIDGHPVKLITKDDAGVPGTSLADAQTLISDHVVAIADASTVDGTWSKTVQAAGVPVIGILTPSAEFFSNPDFYPEGQTDDDSVVSIVATAKAAGATNLGVVYCAEAPICAALVPLVKAAGQKLGLPVVYSASIAMTSPNYTAQCVAAQQAHVTAIWLADTSSPNERFGENCDTQGYDPIYLSTGTGFSMNQAKTAGLEKNFWTPYPDVPIWDNTPAVQAMNTAVDKYYPGLRNNDNDWTEGSAQAWPSAILLEDALKAGGLTAGSSASAAEVISGLQSLHGDTLDGWAPPLTFTAGKLHSVDCWFTGRVQNGTLSLTNNGQLTCQSAS